MVKEEFTLPSCDKKTQLHAVRWLPEEPPRAVLHISHGLAEHILRYTGCDLAMIGRGSFGNPWLFAQANAAAAGQPEPPLPPLDERMDTAYRQIKALAEFSGERIACLEARHHLPWYLHGVAHSGYYKQQLVHVETLEDVERIIAGIKHDLA